MSFIVRKLHSFKILRTLAKKLFSGIYITQKFYAGTIFMDAIEHSWAWTGTRRYESFDVELQNKLLEISLEKTKFIDIGCNIGAMSLSMLLRNPDISVIAIDPNKKALLCLKKSLTKNGLLNRCEIIEAIVGVDENVQQFKSAGSVTGHVASDGNETVQSINFWKFIQTLSAKEELLVKMDIEGYESHLFNSIPGNLSSIKNLTMIIELHPKGFNTHGDPNLCVDKLRQSGFSIKYFNGDPIFEVEEDKISQIIAHYRNDD